MKGADAADTEYRYGIVAVQHGQIAEALGHFNIACALNPVAAQYQAYRAWAKYHVAAANGVAAGEDAEAVKKSCRTAMLHAIGQAPEFDAGYVLLGTILIGEGRLPRAQQAFERALAINPANADARMGLESCKSGA